MNIWDQITQLAHLKMNKEEEALLFPQVQNIIDFFNHISQVSTEGVEPLTTPIDEPLALRTDHTEKEKNDINQDLLNQAPSLSENFVKVPLVVDSDQ